MKLLTHAEYRDFIASKRVAAIHFEADWDIGKHDTRKAMRDAVRLLGNEVAFAEVDVDLEPDLARSIPVGNVPLVAYYRDGRLVAALIGTGQNVRARVVRVLAGEPIGYNDGTDELASTSLLKAFKKRFDALIARMR